MRIIETVDASLIEDDSTYTIKDKKEYYLLKTIHIPKKEKFSYAFLGGMWYSKTNFSFSTDEISLPFPFTTYYTLKITDETIEGKLCRSSIYVKMPIFILQFSDKCYLLQFDPFIKIRNQEIFLYIQLAETKKTYNISFYLPSSYEIKQKEHAWLGRGKKETIQFDLRPQDSFTFLTRINEFENWEEAVLSTLIKILPSKKNSVLRLSPEQVFSQAKQALWRSYDHERGTFLQLPWRETPGFTFVDSSYSLLSYEAVRLDYFSIWYQKTKDEDFAIWMNQLRNLFLNPEMHTTPKQGEGILWYNMTTLTKQGLIGYFYMDTGYSGYPGGQATIDFHLLRYLNLHPNEKLEKLVLKSLQYILSTQKKDGSWPMAIKHEGIIKFRPEKLDKYTSHGGTGEATRALLLGAKYFNDESMKSAAIKGLHFLKDINPICYNGLRDIGIMEPEAFSAVSIINAFLDAYEIISESSYLDYACTYAIYTLPWIYQWNTSKLSFFFNFHPISYSITPRLSPYETAWIISTYDRLSSLTKELFWRSLNYQLFNQVTSWISKTGGLSEGVFPVGFSGFKRLPMEQTFATVELMKSAETLFNKPLLKQKKQTSQSRLEKKYELVKNEDDLSLKRNNKTLFSFDASKAMITRINNTSFEETGITFSFYGSYQKRSLKRKIKKQLRGNVGKYILGSKDATYAITGVKGPKAITPPSLELIGKHLTSWNIQLESIDKAVITLNSSVHSIKITFHFSNKKDKIFIDMESIITIQVHDLPSSQRILFPVVGLKPCSALKNHIEFNDFSILGKCFPLVQEDSYTAIDQTLSTNWTHGGLLKTAFQFAFEDRARR